MRKRRQVQSNRLRCSQPGVGKTMKKFAGVGSQAQYFAICCKIQSASNSYFTMDSQIPDSRHETGESLRKLENDAEGGRSV